MLDMNQKHRQWLATEVIPSFNYILDTQQLPWAAGVCKHVYSLHYCSSINHWTLAKQAC